TAKRRQPREVACSRHSSRRHWHCCWQAVGSPKLAQPEPPPQHRRRNRQSKARKPKRACSGKWTQRCSRTQQIARRPRTLRLSSPQPRRWLTQYRSGFIFPMKPLWLVQRRRPFDFARAFALAFPLAGALGLDRRATAAFFPRLAAGLAAFFFAAFCLPPFATAFLAAFFAAGFRAAAAGFGAAADLGAGALTAAEGCDAGLASVAGGLGAGAGLGAAGLGGAALLWAGLGAAAFAGCAGCSAADIGATSITANMPPCGSVAWAIQLPPGTCIGPFRMRPPPPLTALAALSMSATFT